MIPEETKSFIQSLIDYYISEIGSYRQIAQMYASETGSVSDTTFGIVVGCVYSGFMQSYQSQGKSPDLQEIQEFGQILKDRAHLIKKAIDSDKDKN